MTTLGYDGGSKLQSIQDPAGRITTFAVSGGNLTQMTTPELCITELVYDGSNRLQAYVEPLGTRTTLGYDANSLVNSITDAQGNNTSLVWSDWSTTVVKDANNGVTTYTHNATRSITGVTNPLGERVTIAYKLDQATSFVDGLGNITPWGAE